MTELSVIGKSIPRIDGRAKVTGEAIFAGDIVLPRMLHGKIVRSPLPHAKIISIDAKEALKLPGVEAVVSAKDLPAGVLYGEFLHDQSAFAVDKVRCVGEPVAAVAAVDVATAEKAAELIKVEYEPLPALLDMEEALKPDAPLIHPELQSYHEVWKMNKYGNVLNHVKINRGDMEKGFAESDYIFEDRYTTPIVHNGYIEPHAAVAQVDRAGNITVWASIQGASQVRQFLCHIFQLPFAKVRVIAPTIGGGFGGKLSDVVLEPACIALSQKTGRPVKIVMTREEEFYAANPRHPASVELKTGVKKDGTLVAAQIRILYDSGAFATSGPLTVNIGALKVFGPYRIPNVKIDSICVYTNNPKTGAMRGFGAPQPIFANESQLDTIARKLGIDPLEIRLKNAFNEGDLNTISQEMKEVSIKQTLRDAAENISWGKPIATPSKPGKRRGRGIASSQFQAAGMPAAAFVKINEDGTVNVQVGAVDIGQGSDSVMCQIAAEELGVPYEFVSIVTADTSTTPYDASTIGDRVTLSAGNAVLKAARDARRQILDRTAKIFHCDPNDLDIKNSKVYVKARPEQAIPLIAISMQAHFANREGPIMGKASFFFEEYPYDEKSIEYALDKALTNYNYTTQAVEVEVDEKTGQVDVVKLVAAEDVGFALNPMAVCGQIYGGALMGLGWGLIEGYDVRDGNVYNRAMLDNGIPGVLDAPEMEAIIIEEHCEVGPFGAKSMGNTPLLPTAPAIANAIEDAIGVRITDLPITPEKVLAALKAKKNKTNKKADNPSQA